MTIHYYCRHAAQEQRGYAFTTSAGIWQCPWCEIERLRGDLDAMNRNANDDQATIEQLQADRDAAELKASLIFDSLEKAERLLKQIHDESWPGDHKRMIAAYFNRATDY